MRLLFPALLPLLCGALACTEEGAGSGSDGDVTDFTINLKPVVPLNQGALFQELDTLELVVSPLVGDELTFSLEGSLDAGDFAQATGLPALDQATLSLQGRAGGTVTAFGRSAPLDATTGELDVTMMVAQLDKPGLLGGLAQQRWMGQAVALGDGRFAVMGGTDRASTSKEGGSDLIQIFDISSPSADLTLSADDQRLPALSEDFAGRAGFTITRLAASHSDQGKFLLVGGAKDFLSPQEMTEFMVLWDYETGETEVLDDRKTELREPIAHHTAVEDSAGNVIIAGGLASGAASQTYYFTDAIAVYDARNREIIADYDTFDLEDEGLLPSLSFHRSARLGSDGTLICGGLAARGGSVYNISQECFLVNLSGGLEDVDDLPVPLMHHELVALPGGDVLAIGGLTSAPGQNVDTASMDANDAIFRFDGRDWTSVDEADLMLNARAAFGAALLPDGRVLLVGGISDANDILFTSAGAIACAEIYDPEAGQSVAVDGCTENTDSASLPTRTAYPMVASDPDYGVLIAGGVDHQESVLDQALFFMPRGVED